MTHSFRIRELCVSYHMGQGNSKLLTPRGPGSRTSPCRRASRLVEVQLSSNTSRYQQERGGGRGLRSERPLEHPSRLIRVESPRDSPVAQEPGTVRRSLCSPGEGRPCADAEDLGVEAEGGRLRRTRGVRRPKYVLPKWRLPRAPSTTLSFACARRRDGDWTGGSRSFVGRLTHRRSRTPSPDTARVSRGCHGLSASFAQQFSKASQAKM